MQQSFVQHLFSSARLAFLPWALWKCLMNELPSGTVLWSLISGDLIGDFSELTNLEGLKSLESCCYISNKKVLMGLWQRFTRLTQGYPHSFPLYLQHIICTAIFLLLKKLWRIFLYSKGQCLILFCVFTILDFQVIFFLGIMTHLAYVQNILYNCPS